MSSIGILKNSKLDRKSGNFEPIESFKEPKHTFTKKNTYKNQKSSIKISKTMKNKLDALKYLKKQKYDYEILDILIEFYVNNLSTQEYKRFKEYRDML